VKRKMLRDQNYRQDYVDFMNSILRKNYATKSSTNPGEKAWYVPHHGVRHPVKKKFRVVFDCGAQYKDSCLNDELLQGPDLTNMLLGVLLRFRLGKIGYTGDIESMFYQVRVPPEQQVFLKFLWWPDGDLNQQPQDYQMCVHLFGAVSSPSCANFALRQTVPDNDCKNTEGGYTIL